MRSSVEHSKSSRVRRRVSPGARRQWVACRSQSTRSMGSVPGSGHESPRFSRGWPTVIGRRSTWRPDSAPWREKRASGCGLGRSSKLVGSKLEPTGSWLDRNGRRRLPPSKPWWSGSDSSRRGCSASTRRSEGSDRRRSPPTHRGSKWSSGSPVRASKCWWRGSVISANGSQHFDPRGTPQSLSWSRHGRTMSR